MKIFIIVVLIIFVLLIISLSGSLCYLVGINEGKRAVYKEFAQLAESNTAKNDTEKPVESKPSPDSTDGKK